MSVAYGRTRARLCKRRGPRGDRAASRPDERPHRPRRSGELGRQATEVRQAGGNAAEEGRSSRRRRRQEREDLRGLFGDPRPSAGGRRDPRRGNRGDALVDVTLPGGPQLVAQRDPPPRAPAVDGPGRAGLSPRSIGARGDRTCGGARVKEKANSIFFLIRMTPPASSRYRCPPWNEAGLSAPWRVWWPA